MSGMICKHVILTFVNEFASTVKPHLSNFNPKLKNFMMFMRDIHVLRQCFCEVVYFLTYQGDTPPLKWGHLTTPIFLSLVGFVLLLCCDVILI